MQNLSPRHVMTEESLRLGVVSGWYSTKVSGTFVSGPHDSEADASAGSPKSIRRRRKPKPDRANEAGARGVIKGFEHDGMVMLFSWSPAFFVRCWHIAAPDVCDGTSGVGESRHRFPRRIRTDRTFA